MGKKLFPIFFQSVHFSTGSGITSLITSAENMFCLDWILMDKIHVINHYFNLVRQSQLYIQM